MQTVCARFDCWTAVDDIVHHHVIYDFRCIRMLQKVEAMQREMRCLLQTIEKV